MLGSFLFNKNKGELILLALMIGSIVTIIIIVLLSTIAYNIGLKIKKKNFYLINESVANVFYLFFNSLGIILFFIIYNDFMKLDDNSGLCLVIMTLMVGIIIRIITVSIIRIIFKEKLQNEYFNTIHKMMIHSYIMSLIIIILILKDKDIILTTISVLLGKFLWFDTTLTELEQTMMTIFKDKLQIVSSLIFLLLIVTVYMVTLDIYLLLSIWIGICIGMIISIRIAIKDKFIVFI